MLFLFLGIDCADHWPAFSFFLSFVTFLLLWFLSLSFHNINTMHNRNQMIEHLTNACVGKGQKILRKATGKTCPWPWCTNTTRKCFVITLWAALDYFRRSLLHHFTQVSAENSNICINKSLFNWEETVDAHQGTSRFRNRLVITSGDRVWLFSDATYFFFFFYCVSFFFFTGTRCIIAFIMNNWTWNRNSLTYDQ